MRLQFMEGADWYHLPFLFLPAKPGKLTYRLSESAFRYCSYTVIFVNPSLLPKKRLLREDHLEWNPT